MTRRKTEEMKPSDQRDSTGVATVVYAHRPEHIFEPILHETIDVSIRYISNNIKIRVRGSPDMEVGTVDRRSVNFSELMAVVTGGREVTGSLVYETKGGICPFRRATIYKGVVKWGAPVGEEDHSISIAENDDKANETGDAPDRPHPNTDRVKTHQEETTDEESQNGATWKRIKLEQEAETDDATKSQSINTTHAPHAIHESDTGAITHETSVQELIEETSPPSTAIKSGHNIGDTTHNHAPTALLQDTPLCSESQSEPKSQQNGPAGPEWDATDDVATFGLTQWSEYGLPTNTPMDPNPPSSPPLPRANIQDYSSNTDYGLSQWSADGLPHNTSDVGTADGVTDRANVPSDYGLDRWSELGLPDQTPDTRQQGDNTTTL